ncbi:MAG: holo-ACP synthase [Actinomycetota bacterium]
MLTTKTIGDNYLICIRLVYYYGGIITSRRADAAAALAARFAVREATMKALGVGLGAFDFHDVSLDNAPGGKPSLRVTGRAAELARQRGVTTWHVSLSHTEHLAVAVVAAD